MGQSSKHTRRRMLIDEIDSVLPWSELVALISPFMPEGRRGRPPFAVEVNSFHAAVVQPKRPSHGRGAARHGAVPGLRGLGQLE